MKFTTYRRTACWYADLDEYGNTRELRAEFRPMQYAIGLRIHDSTGSDEIVIELILPFVSFTLAINEIPF